MASGLVEMHENGGRRTFLSELSWEVRGSGEKPLLHLWSERYNVTRRVLAITDHSEHRLTLAVERFGRAKPDRLEFVHREFERGARQLSREEFREDLSHLLAEQFPDETVESLAMSADLEHSLSGNYARGLLRRGSGRCAVLAVPPGESPDITDKRLTFALLWLERARQSIAGGSVAGLRLILPKNTARTVAHRFGALDPRLKVDLYEHDSRLDVLERIELELRETWIPGLSRSRSGDPSAARKAGARVHGLLKAESYQPASFGADARSVVAFPGLAHRALGRRTHLFWNQRLPQGIDNGYAACTGTTSTGSRVTPSSGGGGHAPCPLAGATGTLAGKPGA